MPARQPASPPASPLTRAVRVGTMRSQRCMAAHNRLHPHRSPSLPAAPHHLPAAEISRIIEMAWLDRIPFEDIERAYGLNEAAVIALMRRALKPSSFRLWRRRMTGRATKHRARQQALALQAPQSALPDDAPWQTSPWPEGADGTWPASARGLT